VRSSVPRAGSDRPKSTPKTAWLDTHEIRHILHRNRLLPDGSSRLRTGSKSPHPSAADVCCRAMSGTGVPGPAVQGGDTRGTRMVAKIIDGFAIASSLRVELKARTRHLAARGIRPGLAVIMVGANPASTLYVRNKIRACDDVGIQSFRYDFPCDVSPSSILAVIEELNANRAIHGILVQLPLPQKFQTSQILQTISAEKDVDGFHLYNVGGLVVGETVFPPCTPFGVVHLLEHEGIDLEAKNVVVVGASNIVGKPMALMLMQRDATVCICHAKTRDLAQFTILADILVVAAGRPNLIVPEMVRTGAVVIDVGINRVPDGRVVGDVAFDGVREKASYITPVPGGVGPMTVTMLLANTIASAERQNGVADLAVSAVHRGPQ
jgi:methylenetetrahydrofolate dehydrogenase (NADP+) / methenyltetrahydrofolate cyclohydrolase